MPQFFDGEKRNGHRKPNVTAYNPLMADWLIFLCKIGGFGTVLVLALVVMGSLFTRGRCMAEFGCTDQDEISL